MRTGRGVGERSARRLRRAADPLRERARPSLASLADEDFVAVGLLLRLLLVAAVDVAVAADLPSS